MKPQLNLMILKCLTAVLLAPIFAPSIALATGGGSTGGGSELESAFRLSAYGLINEVSKNSEANRLCDASTMQSGLDGAAIKVVRVLLDTTTSRPILNQSLDAWTTPGLIQLKRSVWEGYLNSAGHFDDSVNALIIHEVYRSSGICNDNHGSISTKVIKLLTTPKPFIQTYQMKYPADLHGEWSNLAFCEKPVNFAKHADAGVVCLAEFQGKWALVKTSTKVSADEFSFFTVMKVIGDPGNDLNITGDSIAGVVLGFASTAHPLLISIDGNSSIVSFGYDLQHLKPFERVFRNQ